MAQLGFHEWYQQRFQAPLPVQLHLDLEASSVEPEMWVSDPARGPTHEEVVPEPLLWRTPVWPRWGPYLPAEVSPGDIILAGCWGQNTNLYSYYLVTCRGSHVAFLRLPCEQPTSFLAGYQRFRDGWEEKLSRSVIIHDMDDLWALVTPQGGGATLLGSVADSHSGDERAWDALERALSALAPREPSAADDDIYRQVPNLRRPFIVDEWRIEITAEQAARRNLPAVGFSVDLKGTIITPHFFNHPLSYLRTSGPPGGALGMTVEVADPGVQDAAGLEAMVEARYRDEPAFAMGAPSRVAFAGAERPAVEVAWGTGVATECDSLLLLTHPACGDRALVVGFMGSGRLRGDPSWPSTSERHAPAFHSFKVLP